MIKIEPLVYEGPDGLFEGVICWNNSYEQPSPGILISHSFIGQGEFDVRKAKALAELGYVGFAIDMYGQGRRATTEEEAVALMNELLNDRPLLSDRINRVLEVLKEQPQVDASKTAAIGFCFGGKCVLDLARSGADTRGVASFHGIFDAPLQKNNAPILASILLLHGWDDPLATPQQVVEVAQELTEREVDWQMCVYGHTGHAFTNPKAAGEKNGFCYNPKVDLRSWIALTQFLEEVFEK